MLASASRNTVTASAKVTRWSRALDCALSSSHSNWKWAWLLASTCSPQVVYTPRRYATPTLSLPGALCLLQDGGGGIGQHLAPQDNIRRVRILSEVVADAPDTRDE